MIMDRAVIKGHHLVVRIEDPPSCQSTAPRKKAYPADWQNQEKHEFEWPLIEPVIGTHLSSMGVCVRCGRVAGTNCILASRE